MSATQLLRRRGKQGVSSRCLPLLQIESMLTMKGKAGTRERRGLNAGCLARYKRKKTITEVICLLLGIAVVFEAPRIHHRQDECAHLGSKVASYTLRQSSKSSGSA